MSDSIALGRTGTRLPLTLSRSVIKSFSKRQLARSHKRNLLKWLRKPSEVVANSDIETAFIYAEVEVPILAITGVQRTTLVNALGISDGTAPRTKYLAAVV
jgi:hypothetical protein